MEKETERYELTPEDFKLAREKFENMDDEEKERIHKQCQETMARVILERNK